MNMMTIRALIQAEDPPQPKKRLKLRIDISFFSLLSAEVVVIYNLAKSSPCFKKNHFFLQILHGDFYNTTDSYLHFYE